MAFDELKQRQSVAWGAGPFEELADTIADVHDTVVERLAPKRGERWLDLACGTGGVAERAAAAGASVIGVDFSPELIETAKRRADERGLDVEYEVGDVERLRFDDASFDIVSSTFGIMFAPDQSAAARELARVTRAGGRIGLANWNPDGTIGETFGMMRPFQPPPPEGAGNPLEWGREEVVEKLLGADFELELTDLTSPYTGESGEEMWQKFVVAFGPMKVLAASLDDERREELHRAYVDFHERFRENGGIRMPRAYLLVTGTRR
jgi:SAM-dependent methyltransferase